LFLLNNNFETYAEINSGLESNFLLRYKQYNIKNEFEIAKKIVKNKVFNQLSLIQQRNKVFDLKNEFKKNSRKIDLAKDEKELLGLEGNYSKIFFREYFKSMNWIRRMPRTKFDISNVLLDIGYTFLFNYIDSLLRLYGFDTYKGFYHKLFFQRKSLACDIMEPFRCIIEYSLLKAFNLGQIRNSDFQFIDGKYQINYLNRQKYVLIFLDSIMKNKEVMFSYVKDFYRFFVVKNREMPFFKLIK